jgi:FkbM family methyltransferase
LRDYVLWNAVRFSLDARHVVRMPEGIEIILGQRENYGTGVYIHSLADFSEMLFLAHLMQPTDLFADVGANVGMYSAWVAGVTGAKAVAMEPVLGTFETLRKNVRLNDLEDLIEPLRTAVGDASGEVLMTTGEGGLDHVLQDGSTADAIRTPVGRLDDILGGRCPTAMKMDVEGFELRALRGGAGALANTGLKAIVIELQDLTLTRYGTSEREVRSFLEGYGFRSHSYDPFSRTLSPSTGLHTGLNDIFVRAGDAEEPRRLAAGRKVRLPGYPDGV